MAPPPTTRLAPSPTGALHLGNARTFLVNWALARQRGWRVLLRIEDLDGPRIKAGAVDQAIRTLRWLGLDWDAGPVHQSHDLQPYQAALQALAQAGKAYPCRCTRAEIAAAAALSAPHADAHDVRYSGACRPRRTAPIDFQQTAGVRAAWRVRTPDAAVRFVDGFRGEVSHNVQQSVGDFVVATKAGLPSYQLAVVVDDARQGVTHVVRGDDLLTSTPRQLLLYDRLGLGDPPGYFHLPMVLGEDGRRLAKRHGDTRVDYYRRRGISPQRVLGLLAEWSGLGPRQPMTASEFCRQFELGRAPADPSVFKPEDDAWLLAGARGS
ncbi:MAG: tRNA glutamyl-Q(34) synthetase GluQRS [Planctomycetota bacterium]